MTVRVDRFTTAALGGVVLHCVRRGDPALPTVVLLHGGGANLHWWDHLAPALAEQAHVVALDFRGHGDSDYPEALEVGAFQRDLEALIEHLGVPDVALVGHSMGAQVAIHHAAAHGGVRSLVAIDVARGGGQRDRRRMRLALAARRTYASREEAIDRYRFLPPAPRADEALRKAIAEHSVHEEGAGRFGFKFDRRWFGVSPLPPPALDAIRCPCLVIRGTESPLLTREGAEALAAEIPNARILEIAGAGHNVHLEQPSAVLAALREHLAPGP